MNSFDPFDISLDGCYLVEASAGTGKTYNIASVYIRLIVERELEVSRILVVTYTEAATEELKQRLLTRLRDCLRVLENGTEQDDEEFLKQFYERVDDRDHAIKMVKRAIHNFDEAAVFTIHGFCYRMLLEQSFRSNLNPDAEIITDDRSVIQEAIDDRWRGFVEEAGSDSDKEILLQLLIDREIGPDKLAEKLSGFVGQPYLKSVVNVPDIEEIGNALSRATALYRELAGIWNQRRMNILEQLDPEVLHRTYYKPEKLGPQVSRLEQWFSRPALSIGGAGVLELFTRSFIQEKTKKGQDPPEDPFFDKVEQLYKAVETVEQFPSRFKKQMLEDVREKVQNKKEQLNVLGYDDLLNRLHRALQQEGTGKELASGIRRNYLVALVDEFQDTDPVQYRIFRDIYLVEPADSMLMMIGDPKQSIYSFRGADVFAYLKARDNVEESRQFGLHNNYRSTPELIKAVNNLFGQTRNTFVLKKISYQNAKPGRKEYDYLHEKGENLPPVNLDLPAATGSDTGMNKDEARRLAAGITAEQVSSMIKKGRDEHLMLGDCKLMERDIAILVRTHREARMIQEELSKRDIKSVQYSDQSVYESEQAVDLERVLRAIADPGEESAVKAALSTELFDITAEELMQTDPDEMRWFKYIERFNEWKAIWKQHGFSFMFRTLVRDEELMVRLIALRDGERKLTNLLQLGELLTSYEREQQAGVMELIKWLARKINNPLKSSEEEQLRLESDERLVKVVTMHRSKGLEYPVVFCPFLWSGLHISESGNPILFHDSSDEEKPSLDLNPKGQPDRIAHRLDAARENLAESMRLAYVAMTRAQYHCSLIWIHATDAEFSPLGYLMLGDETVEKALENKIYPDRSTDKFTPDDFDPAVLAAGADGICLRTPSDRLTKVQPSPGKDPYALMPRNWPDSRTLTLKNAVSSFSAIAHPRYDQLSVMEEAFSDEIYLPKEQDIETSETGDTIFDFPRGPKAGSCIHGIYEDLVFDDPSGMPDIIARQLERYGFESRWSPVVRSMVKCSLQKELDPESGLSLEQVPSSRMLKEMEFYFPIDSFGVERVYRAVREEEPPHGDRDITGGFMKGYIDLVFRYGEQFFILDYKTNHLGNRAEDYSQEALKVEMKEAHYDLQYHIYTAALHRYLGRRLSDYSYSHHFGGVYYLFLRGVQEGPGDTGIFFDRPGEDRIARLEKVFSREAIDG